MAKTAATKGISPAAGAPRTLKQGSIDEIITGLEEDIVLGRLHPRERLIEEELCERFGVSRHVMRLALAELDRMGLVERVPNRGALVRSFSVADVEQLYMLRDMLETAAAAQISFPVAQADIETLKEIQSRHDAAVASDDLVHLFRANHEFHRQLFSLCGNKFLAGAIETYAQQAHGIRFLVLADTVQRNKARQEHHLMIAAIERGDGDALIDLCRKHLPASKQAYLKAYGK